jgi:hypothetical protein
MMKKRVVDDYFLMIHWRGRSGCALCHTHLAVISRFTRSGLDWRHFSPPMAAGFVATAGGYCYHSDEEKILVSACADEDPAGLEMKIVEIFYWFAGAVAALLFVALFVTLGYRFLNWLSGLRKRRATRDLFSR